MKFLKIIGITIIVIFVCSILACLSGNLFFNDTPTLEEKEFQEEITDILEGKKETEKPKVDYITVTAEELITAYEEHEPKADEKYLKKPLIVKGIITEFTTVLGVTSITLGTGKEFEITQITCMFDKENESQVLDLEKGQEIIIHGVCNGKGFNVELKDCEIK